MKAQLDWQDAVVLQHRDLSPTVREITIAPDAGLRPWSVGAHLQVEVVIADAGGDRFDSRSYSLVGLPGDGPHYRIAVKRTEPSRGGSRHMWQLRPGHRLRIAGPNNHFELAPDARPTLIVAGGIGITPLLGMALSLAARGADCSMLYGARSPDELVYADRLQAALGERLSLYSGDGSRMDLAAAIAALPPNGQLLVCGPIGLLDAVRAAWATAGRPASLLRFETFGASGHAAAEPFWVRVPRHGLQIEVPPDRSLLEVLEAHGVAVLHDCKRGECGLCVLDVVELQGRIDHRDVFFSEAEKQSCERLCACVSRISGGGVVLDSAYRPD